MNKLYKKLLVVFLAIVLVLSCSACQFISLEDSGEEQGETIYYDNQQNQNVNAVDYTTNKNLADSVQLSSNVTFNSLRGEKYEEVDEVIENTGLNFASVAINVSSSTTSAMGCGTIVDISKNGENETNIYYILTCHHVIANGDNVTVYLPDQNGRNFVDKDYYKDNSGNYPFVFSGTIGGVNAQGKVNKSSPVSLVGSDKSSDIALLRIYVENPLVKSTIVKAKIMGNNHNVKLGERVFAIGNPTGELPGRVSTGIIAYLNRNTFLDIGEMLLNEINLDIYAGSSGGGLFNMYGELVGITNSGNTEQIGLNGAITFCSNSDAKKDIGLYMITKQLLATSSDYNYGYISGRMQKFGFTVTESYGSVVVSSVNSGSMAESAGLNVNDVVKKIKCVINGVAQNEITISSLSDFSSKIESLSTGDKIIVTVVRSSYTFGGKLSKTEEKQIELTAVQYYYKNTGKDRLGNDL